MNLNSFFLLYTTGCLSLLENIDSFPEKSIIPINIKICNCGERISNSRIVNGRLAEDHEFPWQVAILKLGRFSCGASLINDRYVLSAAHCFKYASDWDQSIITVNLDQVSYMIGTNHHTSGGLERYPIKTVIHGFYNPYTLFCDIAVSKLDVPIMEYTWSTVPICLPPLNRNFKNFEATVIGWGETIAQPKTAAVYLRKTTIEILPEETCNESLLPVLPTFDSSVMHCAIANMTDACQGDSGGPLTVELKKRKHFQIGVVSHGIGCATKYPGVYTRVEKFTSWILIHTSDGIYCDK